MFGLTVTDTDVTHVRRWPARLCDLPMRYTYVYNIFEELLQYNWRVLHFILIFCFRRFLNWILRSLRRLSVALSQQYGPIPSYFVFFHFAYDSLPSEGVLLWVFMQFYVVMLVSSCSPILFSCMFCGTWSGLTMFGICGFSIYWFCLGASHEEQAQRPTCGQTIISPSDHWNCFRTFSD